MIAYIIDNELLSRIFVIMTNHLCFLKVVPDKKKNNFALQ